MVKVLEMYSEKGREIFMSVADQLRKEVEIKGRKKWQKECFN